MIELNKIEVSNFNLVYDGMYFIEWGNHKIRVFLELDSILQMLQTEELTYDDVKKTLKDLEPVHFKKVILIFHGTEKDGRLTLRTSDFSDEYLGKKNLILMDVDVKPKN
jgi:hypothetical protein